ncbi:hypothetical protein EH220_01660 [bacterium]|nr:MAG: hypothetical protein EH220_01660 [bacterium]
MKRFCIFLSTLISVMCLTSGAFALDIQVSPQMLVLSSNGGRLSVHTDVPFSTAEIVVLEVNGTTITANVFADDLGNLVAQCDKDVVKEVIDDFQGSTTTATISLTVNGDTDSEVIRVKK